MTTLLLDTHIALWWWRDLPRLSRSATAAIVDCNDVLVSVASAFEVAQKWRVGKLPMIEDPSVNYPLLMAANGFRPLEITEAHMLSAGVLPGEHRDPFDRVIAAQALAEDLTVVTRDPAFATFGCKVLW